MSECGRKIRNANRMPKSDDRTESNLRRGRREGGEGRWEEDKEEERGGGVGRGEEGERGGGREGRGGGVGGGVAGGGVFDLKNQGLGFAPERNLAIARVTPASFASFRDYLLYKLYRYIFLNIALCNNIINCNFLLL